MSSAAFKYDNNRKHKISASAQAAAYLRSFESQKFGQNAWYVDPYAKELGGPIALDYVKKRRENDEAVGKVRVIENILNLISVRTRKIDTEILKAVNLHNFQQICVVGAGLDTRAWRLQKKVEQTVAYFEIDFPEVFDWKLSVLKGAKATTDFQYFSVAADLSLPGWCASLLKAGFDPNTPTVWLLEGFIGYLTEDEANAFMDALTNVLSAEESRIIATIINKRDTTECPVDNFFPLDAIKWLNSHGWDGTQTDIHDLGKQWGRPLSLGAHVGYMVCVVEKSASRINPSYNDR